MTFDEVIVQIKQIFVDVLEEDDIEKFKTRVVLTAHPTQFYAPPVINIIEDLISAIKAENIDNIKNLLLQMGKTPVMSKEQPTPLDEAKFLINYL